MSPAPRRVARAAGASDNIQDQEVQRAWRELSAYFKGNRTEREARAALKIIKAFVRERERTAPSNRRPLPGVKAATPPPRQRKSKREPAVKLRRRRTRRVTPATATGPASPAGGAEPGRPID